MSFKLTLEFETDEHRNHFIGWFLDGGGEERLGESMKDDGMPVLSPEPPVGGIHADWGWNIPGSGSDTIPATPLPVPLENYTIKMVDNREDDDRRDGK